MIKRGSHLAAGRAAPSSARRWKFFDEDDESDEPVLLGVECFNFLRNKAENVFQSSKLLILRPQRRAVAATGSLEESAQVSEHWWSLNSAEL